MITVLLILAKIKTLIFQAVSAVLSIVAKYPLQTFVLVVAAAGMYYTYTLGKAHAKAEADVEIQQLTALIDQVNKDLDERNRKAKELEVKSKELADVTTQVLSALEKDLASTRSKYESAVKDANTWKSKANAKRDVIVIQPLGEKDPIEVRIQDNKVVCDAFYDEHVDTVNTLLDNANKSLNTQVQEVTK